MSGVCVCGGCEWFKSFLEKGKIDTIMQLGIHVAGEYEVEY